ncbi:MAG: putative bifunctional diguanylate cyclase/phosphodiesterase [Gammaproteobacteria bacterium]
MKAFLQRFYISVILSFALIMLLSIDFLYYIQSQRTNLATQWIMHTHETIETSDAIFISYYAAESKLRGFLLTGNANFIDRYEREIQRINNSINRLKESTQDNVNQQINIKNLETLIQSRLTALSSLINIKKKLGLDAALKNIEIQHTDELSNQIQQALHNIKKQEEMLLSQRFAARQIQRHKTNIILVVGNFLSLSVILICFILLKVELLQRLKIEKRMKQSEAELIHLAYFDPLTGLPNRTQLLDKLEADIKIANANHEKIALLFLDLDHFKSINDSLGHEIGDGLLKTVATHLSQIIGDKNFVARLGSDEFVIVLKWIISINELSNFAENLLQSLKNIFIIKDHRIYITASIGISVFPHHGSEAGTLIKNADIAMYQAKEKGRNSHQICTLEITQHIKKRSLLDYCMREAKIDKEFALNYQPKINFKNGNISGVEVLLRWHNPTLGLVYPGDFISLAEGNGLIIPITEWMIKEACIQSIEWQNSHFPQLNIAINFSIKQFNDLEFIKKIKKIITETKINPNFLEFELTESILMVNTPRNIETIKSLRDLGIKITIDDFGTKYSSLNYLQHFAIDKLKIDCSFIHEIKSPTHNPSIIKAIIVMAHSLGIKVVAEGIETQQQADFLKEHDCDEAQGFFYSHPLTSQELISFMQKI